MAAIDPVVLRTGRLVLDQPTLADVDRMAEYCIDPIFERYMATPWPYRREHAVGFVEEYVPSGWETGREATWALRSGDGEPLLGVVGIRFERPDIGYWLGAPHRGAGLMAEAVDAVAAWAFARGVERIEWECVEGNLASARTARKAGFRFVGAERGKVLGRDGEPALAWHAELRRDDPREPASGWPDEVARRI